MIQWIVNTFFPAFEDETVVFKIKVKKWSQNYAYICGYKVTGFWKYKYDIFWSSLGTIEHKTERGKWSDNYIESLLQKCEDVFVSNARRDNSIVGNKKYVKMTHLISRIDGD